MKLRTIKKVLSINLERLEINAESGATTHVVIKNWPEIFDVIHDLYSFDFLQGIINDIFKIGRHLQTRTPELVLAKGSEYNSFSNLIHILKEKCLTIVSLDMELIESNENQLIIKLPEVKDLKELQSVIDKLDKSLSQCPIFDTPLEIRFDGVERGSNLLFITVICLCAGASVTSLLPVVKFIKSCMECVKLFKEIELIDIEKDLKKTSLDEKQIDEVQKILSSKNDQEVEKKCREIASEISGKEADEFKPEDIARLKHCIKWLADLLEMGMEVYASDEVRPDIRNILPFKDDHEAKYLKESPKPLVNQNLNNSNSILADKNIKNHKGSKTKKN